MKIDKKFILASLFILLFSAIPAQAAKIIMPDQSGNVTIKEEGLKNVYTAGNMVAVDSFIDKDLVAAGNIVTINEDIADDLIIAGGTVLIKGRTGGSARVAGGNVIIEGAVNEDLVVAGGNISLISAINGDLIVAGGVVNIEGPVAGDVLIQGGSVTVNSNIKGNVKATVSNNLSLGHNAKLERNLIYRSPKEALIADGAEILGTMDYSIKEKMYLPRQMSIIYFIIKIVAAIIAGLVLIWLFHEFTNHVAQETLKTPWTSLGIGAAALILTPLLMILLLLSLIGSWISAILAVSYGLSILLSMILAPIFLGSFLLKWLLKKTEYPINWRAVVLGVLAMNLIILIPYIGWLLSFLLYLAAFGALYKLVYHGIRE